MRRKKLAIFGAGGLGRELKAWIQRIDSYELIGFFDDHIAAHTIIEKTKVLGGINDIKTFAAEELHLVIAVGSPQTRAAIIQDLDKISGISFPVLIHPAAVIDDVGSMNFGKGTVITAGCALTTNITLGDHVLVNLNSTIGHDCVIGEGSCIMPGVNISGKVTLGKHVLLGTGSSVLNNVTIGENAKVGAGAVVTRSLPPNCTAVGVPAKLLTV